MPIIVFLTGLDEFIPHKKKDDYTICITNFLRKKVDNRVEKVKN